MRSRFPIDADHVTLRQQVQAAIESLHLQIRAGFILLQAGMALGLIGDCIAIMKGLRPSLGHINAYLDQQPEDFEASLARDESEAMALAATPYDASADYWQRVIAIRLRLGEASVAAANAAMLHCGARGYLKGHRAQRRLREMA